MEMNMHIPQNILAETELKNLAAIQYQIISPANNSPIIGIYQDSLLGSFRFTRPGVFMTPREAMNLLMTYPHVNVDELRKSGNKISSFAVLSQIFPPMTSVSKTKLFEDGEDYATSNNVVEIRNGRYLRGQLDKGALGSSTKGILHRIYNDFGNIACSNFNDNLQNIVTEWMKTSSFSVGVSDLMSDNNTQVEIAKVIKDKKEQVQLLTDKVHLGIFENNTASTNNEDFEMKVNSILNDATNQSGNIGRKSLSKDNRFLMIVNSGSKGSVLNISQMISCLGQQNVDGKRIPYGFDNRTLPHYNKYDDSPNARGFIENSYISGLTAPELFFHAMGGRIGLIDTAVKSVTWETTIVIIEDDKPVYTEIGRWIDAKLEKSPSKVRHFEEKNMELLDLLDEEVYIPTTNEKGVVTWGELTAVTRHDPGERLYEVKTMSGRSVTVAESKSLLIWNAEKKAFLEMNSPDVKLGDFVPVTVDLCNPPVEMKCVDMKDYLPKTEYVYGTEFNRAVELMKGAMDGRNKIPAGWWNKNNGTTFTLPYTKKSSLQRTIVRSNTDNIIDGFVYPYNAQRTETFIPDKFELNEENGIFVGLFLADGNAHTDHITITKNNENVKNFVKYWFSKHSICFKEREKITTNEKIINGKTTTITGNCAILYHFLNKFVGSGAENKHVPTEAFIAPEPFVIGLLNGYFSGDGSVNKDGSVNACSVSSRLIEGISMLCSRLGIFGKIHCSISKPNNATQTPLPTITISIRAQWARLFASKITLLENNKNDRLKNTLNNSKTNKHLNFKQHNNVVLDAIVEINVIGVENHPKLYDVTVPSTLNFCLSNGLQSSDTSQTGYIQRRLIKGLEDLKVEYDMTVRNNKGKIIQFSYGEDGFDSTKVENQILPLVGMSIEDIYVKYDIPGITDKDSLDKATIFTKGAVTRMNSQRAKTIEKNKQYIEKMIQQRDAVVKNIFKYKNENTVRMPVSFQNIIANIQGQLGLSSKSSVDITPLEAFDMIEEYYTKINATYYIKSNDLFETMYFFYMNPKDLLVLKRFHKKGLVLLLETILLKFKEALVHPGEMVGIIAGQSIGEPCTQLTLNTFHNAGVASKSNVTRGVPRTEEILRLTKNPKNPSMTVFMRRLDETNQDKATSYSTMLEHTRLVDIVKSVQIRFDPNEKGTCIEEDKMLLSQFYEFEKMLDECLDKDASATATSAASQKSKWIIRMEMNTETMLDKNITMDDVHFAMTNSAFGQEINCVYSDYNTDKLVFRVRINSSMFSKNKRKGIAESLDQSDEIYLIKTFQDSLLNNIVLRGVNGIQNVLPFKMQNMLSAGDAVKKEDGKYVKNDIWTLNTTGSNLLDTFAMDFIDYTRTFSNDIKEVFSVLGIEAARQMIYNEISEVMEFNDVYINYHHTSLLCDRMTCNKDMVSIFRSGLLNDNVGPIAKATFEVHTEAFLNAARHADFDHMRGVSANVMCGQYGYYGTSSFGLVLDMTQYEGAETAEVDVGDTEAEIDAMFAKEDSKMDGCRKTDLVIDNHIHEIMRQTVGGEGMDVCADEYDAGF
jgi:DNA-directed RNA polymerase beta' subunit/intein/homing endonuclease